MSACLDVLLRQFCRQLRRAGLIVPSRDNVTAAASAVPAVTVAPTTFATAAFAATTLANGIVHWQCQADLRPRGRPAR